MFSLILLAFIFLSTRATTSTIASPSSNTSTLQTWKITTLSTYSPTGRTASRPYTTFFVSITNLNTIPLPATQHENISFPPSTANCGTKGIDSWYIHEDPFGKVLNCEVAGFDERKWTMGIQRANASEHGPSATRDFTLQFSMEESMELNEGTLRWKFVRRVGFVIGENWVYLRGEWVLQDLDEGKSPQLMVPVLEVECLG